MQMKILCPGVGKTFIARQGTLEVLRDVELEVPEGEFCCLVGPSGCGKSTLLRILAGLTPPTRGMALIQTRSGADGPACAIVFQEHALFPWKTVLRNVAFGLQMQGVARSGHETIARRVIAKVGLDRFEGYYPHQLSGGMKQRVGIARALAPRGDQAVAHLLGFPSRGTAWRGGRLAHGECPGRCEPSWIRSFRRCTHCPKSLFCLWSC